MAQVCPKIPLEIDYFEPKSRCVEDYFEPIRQLSRAMTCWSQPRNIKDEFDLVASNTKEADIFRHDEDDEDDEDDDEHVTKPPCPKDPARPEVPTSFVVMEDM